MVLLKPKSLRGLNWLTLAVCFTCQSAIGQTTELDVVVLTNFQHLSGTVTAVDDTAVYLSDGSQISWHRVAQVRAASIENATVDDLLQRIASPASRVAWRLKTGDFAAAATLANDLLQQIPDGESELRTMLWLAVASGKRDSSELTAASTAYFHALPMLIARPDWLQRIPPSVALPPDPSTKFPDSLLPVWLQTDGLDQARQVADQLLAAQPSLDQSPLTMLVYAASLAIDADPENPPESTLQVIESMSDEWSSVLQWQLSVRRGEIRQVSDIESAWLEMADWSEQSRACGRFWLGQAELMLGERIHEAAIKLLHIPANDGRKFPDLAAASLELLASAAANGGDPATAEKLRDEIHRSYSDTIAGRKLAAVDQ